MCWRSGGAGNRLSPGDIRRLIALADLAAIALDNARQHQISSASRRAVEVAHRALQAQLGKVEQALAGQQELIEALIDGEQLPGIARIVGERSGCEVALLDSDLEVLAGPVTDHDSPSSAAPSAGSATFAITVRQTRWVELNGRSGPCGPSPG